MPSTIDVKEAIKNILFQHWNLHGELSKANLKWSTGVPAAARQYPSIEVLEVSDPTAVMTTIWLQRNALIQVHIFVRPRTNEKDALEKAKHTKHLLVEEATNILWANQITVQDVSWIHPLDSICVDQYHALDEDVSERNESSAPESRADFTPVLHELIPVEAVRFHNAYTGGVQMNRTN